MKQKEGYKERMLDELILLVAKIERLSVYLESIDNKPVNEEKDKIDIMYKQLDYMFNYRACLVKRILLEMK